MLILICYYIRIIFYEWNTQCLCDRLIRASFGLTFSIFKRSVGFYITYALRRLCRCKPSFKPVFFKHLVQQIDLVSHFYFRGIVLRYLKLIFYRYYRFIHLLIIVRDFLLKLLVRTDQSIYQPVDAAYSCIFALKIQCAFVMMYFIVNIIYRYKFTINTCCPCVYPYKFLCFIIEVDIF